jgi:hypothetical protein
MNKFIVRAAFLFAAGSISAAQIQPQEAPSYQISHPSYQYAMTVSSLRDVDFKNFKGLTAFRLHDNKPDESVNLVDGKFSQRYPEGGGENVILELVKFIDGDQRAVIDIAWTNCGGSCADGGLVQVFELQAGHPTVDEQIIYDRHAPGTGVKLDVQSRILTVTGRSAEHAPNCCAKSLDVMSFEWGDDGFIFKNCKRVTLPGTP